MPFQITIEPIFTAPGPTIVMGFSNETFSQAVFINVDRDPLNVVAMANQLAEQFVNACAAAVKPYNQENADEDDNVR